MHACERPVCSWPTWVRDPQDDRVRNTLASASAGQASSVRKTSRAGRESLSKELNYDADFTRRDGREETVTPAQDPLCVAQIFLV